MHSLDLSQLFSSAVAVSASEVTPTSVDKLRQLSVEETPVGYASWAEKRQREYRSGRHHARQALTAAGAPAVAILRGEEGIPLFPSGYFGSITHTGRETTYAAAVATRAPLRVGIDAEELRDLPQDMVSYILTDEEQAHLGTRPTGLSSLSTIGQIALLAFSAKEAFYKCVYPDVRVRFAFHDVCFILGEVSAQFSAGTFQIRLAGSVPEGAPAELGGRFVTDDRHVVCGVEWTPEQGDPH